MLPQFFYHGLAEVLFFLPLDVLLFFFVMVGHGLSFLRGIYFDREREYSHDSPIIAQSAAAGKHRVYSRIQKMAEVPWGGAYRRGCFFGGLGRCIILLPRRLYPSPLLLFFEKLYS